MLTPGLPGLASDWYESVQADRAVLWAQSADGDWISGARVRILPRVEAGFTMSAESLFEPEMRIRLVQNLAPLRSTLIVASRRIAFLTKVLLGPVHAEMGRAWGTSPLRWAAVTVAGNRTMALAAGWRMPGGLTAEIRVHVAFESVWELSLFFRDGSVGIGCAAWR